MNCTVKLKDIIEAVKFCLQFVSKKHSKLSHIQFTVTRKKLTAYTFDGDTYATRDVPCQSNTSHGQFLLNAERVEQLLDVCQSDELVMMCDDHYSQITFQDGTNKYEFKTFDTLLPTFPEVDTDSTVLPDRLFKLAKLLAAATDSDNERYQLAGINFEFKDGDMRVATSDGRRICVVKESCSVDINGSVLIPSSVIRKMQSLSGLSFCYNNTMAKFWNDDTQVCTMKLQGRFPNLDHILDSIPETTAARTFDIGQFRKAVRNAAIICDSDNPQINIDISERHCTVRSEVSTRGKSEVSVDFERATGESNFAFSVNHKFLLSALDNVDPLKLDTAKLIFRDLQSPVRLEFDNCFYELAVMRK